MIAAWSLVRSKWVVVPANDVPLATGCVRAASR